jgi:hypothetical protein
MLGEKSVSVQARRRIICPNDSSFSLSMNTTPRLAAILATIGHRNLVLREAIAHKPVTHTVKVQWVLTHR